jgi:hypothetical protein
MPNLEFVFKYVQYCTGGAPMGDCGPVWSLVLILILLIIAVTALLVMRFRGPQTAEKA